MSIEGEREREGEEDGGHGENKVFVDGNGNNVTSSAHLSGDHRVLKHGQMFKRLGTA